MSFWASILLRASLNSAPLNRGILKSDIIKSKVCSFIFANASAPLKAKVHSRVSKNISFKYLIISKLSSTINTLGYVVVSSVSSAECFSIDIKLNSFFKEFVCKVKLFSSYGRFT